MKNICRLLLFVSLFVQLGDSPSFSQNEVDALILRATRGDADAQSQLGQMYLSGENSTMADGSAVKRNYTQAIQWLEQAASGDTSKPGALFSQFFLGKVYFGDGDYHYDPDADGVLIQRDYAKASRWLNKFINTVEPMNDGKEILAEARYTLGQIYYQECDTWLIDLSCDFSDVKNRYPKGYEAARNLFQQSSDAGHRQAPFYLGTMYENGRGVPQDFEQAAKYYEMSAIRGNREALAPLGRVALQINDLVNAYKWFNLAAAGGDSKAAAARSEITVKLSPEQLVKAQKMATDWMAEHQR